MNESFTRDNSLRLMRANKSLEPTPRAGVFHEMVRAGRLSSNR